MKTRIKDLRTDNDLTQAEIASAIGITQRKYSYLETGRQQLTDDLLVRLAVFYKTSIDYLLGLTDDPRPYPRAKRREMYKHTTIIRNVIEPLQDFPGAVSISHAVLPVIPVKTISGFPILHTVAEVMIMLDRLRGLREDKDLTQEDMAEILNVSQSTYSDYELEKINIPIISLRKLSEYFGTSVDYILELTDESRPYPRRKQK